jgi:hypothetical protein
LVAYFDAIIKSFYKKCSFVVMADTIVGAFVVYASFLDDLDVSLLKLVPFKYLK